MEFKIQKYNKPDVIEFNYKELKNEIEEKVGFYSTLVYDEKQVKEAKADKASLNRLKTALNDERLRIQREYMEPFNGFKAQVDELIKVIEEPVGIIDKQIKEFDEKRKEEKVEKIKEKFEGLNLNDFLKLEQIWNPKWLNASYSMPKISQEIEDTLHKIRIEMQTLASLEAYSFEAVEYYKQHLDMTAALNETKRLAEIQRKKEEAEEEKRRAEEAEKRKAEEERKKAEEATSEVQINDPPVTPTVAPVPVSEPVQEVGEWVRFEAFLTVSQAKDLKWFFETKGIDFKAIGKER